MSLEFGRAEIEDRPRAKRHQRKESRSDETGRGSATESAYTKASAKRDAEHRIRSSTLTGRELLHEREFVAVW